MKWVVRILQVLLVLAFASAGLVKVFSNPDQIREWYTEPLGYSVGFMYFIGVCEVLGAIGLIVAFWKQQLTLLPLAGLFIIIVGAVVSCLVKGLYVDSVSPSIDLIFIVVFYFTRRAWLNSRNRVVQGHEAATH